MSDIIGEREGQHLEFKRGDVLGRPHKIAREVVGMLNAEGGRVLVGVVEEGGIARAIESFDDIDSSRSRLSNALLDLIEPSPRSEEVSVESLSADGGEILAVEVGSPQGGRGPFALLHSQGRQFVRRWHDQNRPMDRTELRTAFSGGAPERAEVEELDLMRQAALDGGLRGLWLGLQPAPEMRVTMSRADYEALGDPVLTGNRPSGWTFAGLMMDVSRRGQTVTLSRGVTTELDQDTGIVRFEVPLELLMREGDIYPLALVEYPTSVVRLMGYLLSRYAGGRPRDVLAGIALSGIEGLKLRPYSPDRVGYHDEFPGHEHQTAAQEVIRPKALSFNSADVVQSPDRCAWRLLRQVYSEFGYWEEHMPAQYDRDEGVLRL